MNEAVIHLLYNSMGKEEKSVKIHGVEYITNELTNVVSVDLTNPDIIDDLADLGYVPSESELEAFNESLEQILEAVPINGEVSLYSGNEAIRVIRLNSPTYFQILQTLDNLCFNEFSGVVKVDGDCIFIEYSE